MKEKKFNDITGFGDKNTFYQFDTWETQRLWGAKNRFVYDFSFMKLPGLTAQETALNGYFTQNNDNATANINPLENLGPHNWGYLGADPSTGTGRYGYAGNLCQMIQYPGIGVGFQKLAEQNSLTDTINKEESTIVIDKNTIANIDTASSSVFSVQLDNWVDYFRSGYVEFSIKTNKQNCIIASGTTEVEANNFNFLGWLFGSNMSYGINGFSPSDEENVTGTLLKSVDTPYYEAASFDGALINLNIEIFNGKLRINYYDDYNRDNVNFIFDGNENISDNKWHHIVINFGRPGLIKQNGTKFNKKFIEIWVDGQLDKRFDDKINNYQIFYPTVKYLFNNLSQCVKNVFEDDIDIENNLDYRPSSGGAMNVGTFTNAYRGLQEILGGAEIFKKCVQNDKNSQNGFIGAIHTFAHGINIPLTQYEIKTRYRLWQKDTKTGLKAKVIKLNAEMKNPIISTNSKKALKLYWNELVENGKYGLSLDNNLQVESYSVTHKCEDSKTDIFNIDKAISKEVIILKNVRAAFKDNIIITGPGKVYAPNLEESQFANGQQYQFSSAQFNPKDNKYLDSTSIGTGNSLEYNNTKTFYGPRSDLYMSGLNLIKGDRILLTNQIKTEENGIWIFNGMAEYLTRDVDSLISDNTKTYIVYVTEGYESGTYWKLNKAFTSLSNPQKWTLVEGNDIKNLASIPTHSTRWKDYHGEDRLINLQDDIDINKYDLIVFMNYPESNEDIFKHFPNDPEALVMRQYSNFIQSLKNVVANGAKLYVSSPRLAQDLGIVKGFTEVPQLLQPSDAASISLSPFELIAPADRYFDNHRINKYKLVTTVPGLTDKETYILTDFINFTPETEYDYDQYHAKYSYRQFGLQEGNEFIIPGTALRKITEKDDLPGYRQNQLGTKPLLAVAPFDILAGTSVTRLVNNYYNNDVLTPNLYSDYATTIIVHNGQMLGGTPINGKIFVNCIEDGYTFSREEYNKAFIQVLPENDINETVATRQWQYSTTRLDRKPQRLNISGLSSYGQTVPTNGGGGAFIQAPSNSSYGVIRYETDKNNVDYQSDLYPTQEEEIYPLQEIPVLSMTWLGLQWLAG